MFMALKLTYVIFIVTKRMDQGRLKWWKEKQQPNRKIINLDMIAGIFTSRAVYRELLMINIIIYMIDILNDGFLLHQTSMLIHW